MSDVLNTLIHKTIETKGEQKMSMIISLKDAVTPIE